MDNIIKDGLGMKHKLNLERILNNTNINFFILLNIALFIGCYNLLNKNIQHSILSIISYPIVTFILLSIALFISYYNTMLGILLIILLFAIIYPIHNNNDNNNNDNDNNDNNNVEQSKEQININEGFISGDEYEMRKKEKRKEKEKKEREERKIKNFLPEIKNNFKNLYEELEQEYENDLKEGIKENLQDILEEEKNYNKKNRSNRKYKGKKENFDNTDSFENEKNKKNRRIENYKTIAKRKFNPNDETDANLLISKEIFKDLLNRITYEYESNELLKKYIEHRLEEIIDLNKFINSDN